MQGMSEHLQIGLIDGFSLHQSRLPLPTPLGIKPESEHLGAHDWLQHMWNAVVHMLYTVPPLYTSLLHTQPWSDDWIAMHLAHTEAIKLIHMTSALCAWQHRQAYTEAIAVHAVLVKSNEEINADSYPLVEYQGHTYMCTHIHLDKTWLNLVFHPLAWTLTLSMKVQATARHKL